MTTTSLGPRPLAIVSLASLAVLVMWAMYIVRDVLLLIYISGILAIGFSPLVRAIEHQTLVPVGTRRLPRWLAILVVYLSMVGVLTLLALMVVPPLVAQARALVQELPSLLERAQSILIEYGVLNSPITLEDAVRSAPMPGDAVGTITTAVTGVVSGVAGFVTILILTFYLLIESASLSEGLARLFPRAERPRVRDVSRQISDKVSAWMSGQLILASTIGLSAAIGLYVLGVPYFYVLAFIAAIGELIPVVGPIFAAVPGVLVAFTVSPRTGIFVLIFFLVQQQVENHLLVPKVMERQVGVSAVTVIVALLIGGSLLGIVGALLAVPSAAIVQVVIQELLDERDRMEATRIG